MIYPDILQIFQWIHDLFASEATNHQGGECEAVFCEFAKAVSASEAVPKLYDTIWHSIASMMQEVQELTTRHFLFLYALASNGMLIASTSTKPKASVKFGLAKAKAALPELPQLTEMRHKQKLGPIVVSCMRQFLRLHVASNENYCFAISCLEGLHSLFCEEGLEAEILALIEPQVLQAQSLNMELHVRLCVNLLNHEQDADTKGLFYERVTTLNNPDWVLAFISGFLLRDDPEGSIKTLIASEAFTQKLQETLEEKDLTEKGTRLLLTAMKFGTNINII